MRARRVAGRSSRIACGVAIAGQAGSMRGAGCLRQMQLVRAAIRCNTACMFFASVPDFTVISCIFFAAGAVKGVLGMGLPTVAMGMLGLVMPVAQAATLLAVPSLVTNVWQAGRGPHMAAL